MTRMTPIVFLHLPRTGGLSMREIMHEVYGRENVGYPWLLDSEGSVPPEKQQVKKAWYGHFRYGVHKFLRAKPKYFTLMREPSERFLSEYIRNKYRERYGLTPLQLANNLDKCHGFDKYGDNIQVRLISGIGQKKLTVAHVVEALKNIRDNFVHVGFTDRYARTTRFLKDELGWQFKEVPHINKDQGVDDVTDEEIEELRKCPQLALDYELWNEVRGEL